MVLDYTITDKMIAYVASVSEKTGRIKEIRNANGHIDFDRLCNVKNIQNALERVYVSLSRERIDFFISERILDGSSFHENEIDKINSITHTYSRIKEYDPYKLASLRRAYALFYKKHNYTRDLNCKESDLEEMFQKLSDKSKGFILYRICVFCMDVYDIICDYDIFQLWLVTLFRQEYGMVLFLPFSQIMNDEYDIYKMDKDIHDELFDECEMTNSPYPFCEFYLSVIDRALDWCIDFHYELVHPVAGRVEMLKGVIKEPFSRKDYMAYHKVSAATASLDLRKAVEKGILSIKGDKRRAMYRFKK